MDKSSEWKVVPPMLALVVLEVGAEQLLFGGAYRLGLGIGVEYVAGAVFLLAGLSLSVYSLIVLLQFKKRHNLKIVQALTLATTFLLGLLPIVTILFFIKLRHDFQEIFNKLP